MASNFEHRPVLLAEVLQAVRPRPGGLHVDGTLGGGGHAAAVLAASSPTGRLVGCDRDGSALAAAQLRLAEFAGRFELQRGNFDELGTWVDENSCDSVLFDLGVSSHQLDTPERGFSFRDGPLDMRMDVRQALTAAELVNRSSIEELANLFWELGDERDSRRFARAIVMDRVQQPFTTTGQLAALIERLSPRAGRKTHPATKVFQALRLAVNDEMGALKRGLAVALRILKPGGRLAVITFHSLEDRIVKLQGREWVRDYTFPGELDVPELRTPRQPEMVWVTRKAIKPGATELAENPRSRSAQLRVLEKI